MSMLIENEVRADLRDRAAEAGAEAARLGAGSGVRGPAAGPREALV
ncbi:hypothetical protein ACFQ6N_38875 [Kitasatospora sp. NPDC056446]